MYDIERGNDVSPPSLKCLSLLLSISINCCLSFQPAFEMLGVIAVITNCALIGMAAKSAHWLPEMSTVNAILMFVAIEVRTRHSLLSGCFFSSAAQRSVWSSRDHLWTYQTANKLEWSYAIAILKRERSLDLYTKQSERICYLRNGHSLWRHSLISTLVG